MATRSHIGKKLENGTIKYIYCHFDGYPEYNGRILKEYYTDESKIDALLELGSIRMLGEEIEITNSYTNEEAQITELLSDITIHPYSYIWDNGRWRCYRYNEELVF